MTLRYLLDTNTVSYALRGTGNVKGRLLGATPGELAVSVITVAELRYGACKRGSAKLDASIDAVLASLVILPVEEAVAVRYGSLAAELDRLGAPIGPLDAMIAAHALTVGLVLVTHDAHFRRVSGLLSEDWF